MKTINTITRVNRNQAMRKVVHQLPILLPQRTVAEILGISRTMVEFIELEALWKVSMRLKEFYRS